MLDELHIRGLGVIEEASLRLAPGLTVVTGETGAGKTMLVTALQLLLGARADTSLVRAGVETAVIDARVVPPPPDAIGGGWVGDDEEELVVSREVPSPDSDGRSRARIGGRLATVSSLRDVLASTFEVHAQGEHVRLARPAVQRALLDRFAGDDHASVLDAYRKTYDAWGDARSRLEEVRSGGRERAREIDRLRHELEEIDRAGLDPVEDADLAAELERLEHAEELTRAAAEAANALADQGAGGPAGVAVAALRSAGRHDPELADLHDRVEALAVEMADVRRELRGYAEGIRADQDRLEELRRRRRLVTDLTRKYGDDVSDVLRYADEARVRLEALEAQDSGTGDLERRVDALTAEVTDLAADVHRGRAEAADRLAVVVSRHLADLALPQASFGVRVESSEALGADGSDRVVFELAANPGEPARPFADAASGGERSRVALAIEVALATVDDAQVLVFDEVDAGVAGATALAVGEKLARLAAGAEGRQVLCVTHLAQLAAFADVHHVVEKEVRDGRTVTTARRVADDDRAAELARMLSGTPDRETALEHARELLEEAAARSGG